MMWDIDEDWLKLRDHVKEGNYYYYNGIQDQMQV